MKKEAVKIGLRKSILLLLIGLLLLSIGIGEQQIDKEKGFHVVVATGSSLSIFTDVAKVYGTYNKSGIVIDKVLIVDAFPGILIHGDVDFHIAHTIPYLRAISSGAPIKLVGEVSDRNPIMLIVRKGKKDEIKSIYDLKKKRVLSLSPGTSPYKVAVQSIKKAGLRINKDVTLITIGKASPGVVLSMFKRGEADAAFLSPHLSAPLIAKNVGVLVDTPSKPILNAGVFVKTKYIEEKKAVVKAFICGTDKTLKIFEKRNAKEIARRLLEDSETRQHYKGYDEVALATYIEIMKQVLANGVVLNEEDFKAMVNFAKGLLDKKANFNDICDPSFAGKK